MYIIYIICYTVEIQDDFIWQKISCYFERRYGVISNRSSQQRIQLVEARRYRGWSQKDLAEQLGTTQANVSRWERGLTTPAAYFRSKLIALLRKSAEELDLFPQEIKQNDHRFIPSLWNIPHRRNPLFTGREELLTCLRSTLSTKKVTGVTQIQALSGLAGIGKTQIAIEYAYRYRDEYSAILWLRAETHDVLIEDAAVLAELLKLPEKDEQDQSKIIKAIKHWLEESSNWLLILDNVEDFTLLAHLLPRQSNDHILVTTRTQIIGPLAERVTVERMEPNEGTLFLLRRAKLVGPDALLEESLESLDVQARNLFQMLDGLPLALDQAGAYIEETGCNLSDYQERYQQRRMALLERRGKHVLDHPQSVSATFSLLFEKVEQTNSAASELLQVCAFLAPDAIPIELFIKGASELGSLLEPLVSDPLALDDALTTLRTYSFLCRGVEPRTLTIHRLVQAVLKDKMDEGTQYFRAEQVIRVVNQGFPNPRNVINWSACQHYLPHAQVCVAAVQQWNIISSEATHLLQKVGVYLLQRAHYDQSELMLKKALSICIDRLGPEHLDVASILNDLSELYYLQSKYTEMEIVAQQALAVRQRILGSEHPDVAESLNNLALLYYDQGHYARSELLHQQALAIRQRTLGSEHPDVAESLNNLAMLYQFWGKYTQAEQFFPQALAIYEKALGAEHTHVALCLNNFAMLHRLQGKYLQAELLYQRALVIRKKLLGSEHPEVANTLSNLAVLYLHQGKHHQAEQIHLQALKLREKVLGMDHSDVALSLSNIAHLYAEQGRNDEAEVLYQRALAIREHALGLEHLRTAQSLDGLAQVYSKQGRYDKAEPLYLRALIIREQQLGWEHADTVATRENYMNLLRNTEREEEANLLKKRLRVR